MKGRRIHVSIVLFPECDPSIVYGVFDTLWAAGRMWEMLKDGTSREPLFEPLLVGAEAGPLQLVTGVSVLPQAAIADVARTDIVFVPNVMVETAEALGALDRRLLAWIRRMHQGGAHLYSACGGSLVLAEAGLLDGHQATTHWCYVPLFRQRYPNVRVHEERLLVQTGPGHSVVCSGGASSWQDLALLLIAKHGGTQEAIRISKIFLYQWLPYASMIANINHGDAAILRCQSWLAQNYERPDIVAELVRQSGLPKRTFDRRFRAATGYSPLAYIQALRIEEAKQALETGSAPVEVVAREVGYSDAASFRRLAGMTPGDYRRKFQVPSFIARAAPARKPGPKESGPKKNAAPRGPCSSAAEPRPRQG